MSAELIAPGVAREDHWWGYVLEGARDALISTGLAKPEWFADGIARNKYGKVIRSIDHEVDGRKAQTRMLPKRGIYIVRVSYTTQEKDARERREKLDAGLRQERDRIAALPKSADDYRARREEGVRMLLNAARDILVADHGGYRFDKSVDEVFDEAFDDLIDELRTRSVLYSAKGREAEIQRIKAETARRDPTLQSLLIRAQVTPLEEEAA